MFLVPEQETTLAQIAMIKNKEKCGFISYVLWFYLKNTNEPKKWVFLAHSLCNILICNKLYPPPQEGNSLGRKMRYDRTDSIAPIIIRKLIKIFGICNRILRCFFLFNNMILPIDNPIELRTI